MKMLALKLLDRYDKHISSKMLLLHGMSVFDRPFDQDDTPPGFTGLHGVAYLGCVEIAVALLKMNKCDVQATDFYGNTAIAWAAGRGHERVTRILLERNDTNPNTADTQYGRTPLSQAAGNRHEEIVRILLERDDVNPNQAGTLLGQTPLSWAAENGHEGVVRTLLERDDINPNKTDTNGRTPLWWATRRGHKGVMRIPLKGSDVSHNIADTKYA